MYAAACNEILRLTASLLHSLLQWCYKSIWWDALKEETGNNQHTIMLDLLLQFLRTHQCCTPTASSTVDLAKVFPTSYCQQQNGVISLRGVDWTDFSGHRSRPSSKLCPRTRWKEEMFFSYKWGSQNAVYRKAESCDETSRSQHITCSVTTATTLTLTEHHRKK